MHRRAVLSLLPSTLALFLVSSGGPARAADRATLFSPAAPPSRALAVETPAGIVHATLDREAMRRFRVEPAGRLALPLPDGEVTLALERFEILAPDARVVATGPDGDTPLRPDVALFRGGIEGQADSWAVLSFSPDQVLGIVSTAAGRYAIAPPATPDGPYTIAAEHSLEPPGHGFECSAPEPPGANAGLPRGRIALPEALKRPSPTRLVCELSVDCDYELYANKFGSNLTSETHYIMTLLGTASLVYERDLNVSFTVTYLNLWTTPDDPWTRSDMSSQLDEYGAYWSIYRPNWPRQLGFLLCGHSIGGGAAWIEGLCDYYKGFGVAQIDAWYTYPTNSTTWDVEVVTHEIGHLFGARHTHSCWWQDGGFVPAGALIDTCYTPEGTCITGYTLHVPPDKGTIMSYCHQRSPGISNIRLDFHPACIPYMRSLAQTTCLTAAPVQPPRDLIVTLAGAVNIVGWTPSPTPGVARTDVYRSAYKFDLNPVRIGSTTAAAFVDSFPGDYSYKARAFRAADSSAFSNEARPTACGLRSLRSYDAGTTPVAVIVNDFDENGIPDLAIADSAGSRIVVLKGVRDEGSVDDYDVPRTTAVGTAPRALAAGDFDHDGILDLAVVGPGLLTILKGQGVGGVGFGTFTTGSTTALADAAPAALVTADFDEDGIADLAVAGAAGLTVLHGQGTGGVGNGAFVVAATHPAGTGAAAIARGDLNADGITDLVVSSHDSIGVFLGQGAAGRGNGSFGARTAFRAAGTPYAVATGDFDEDGITDLAVADAGGSRVAVLRGQGGGGAGDGTFASPVFYSCGSEPTDLAVCDLDGDGIRDLVTANFTGQSVSLLRGLGSGTTGNGTFASATQFAAGGIARALAVRDLDEDGRADIVVANGVTPGRVTQLLYRCAGALSNALAVTSPVGGEQWVSQQERTITWTKGAGVVAVSLDVSRDRGVNWQPVAANLTGTSHVWTVTEPFTRLARFRVWDASVPTRWDQTDSSLTIIPASAVGVEKPAAAPFALEGARPNPARAPAGGGAGITVSFSLASASPARLELFDLVGRRVSTLEVGGLGPGPHRVELGGGAPLAPGVYLVRLTQGIRVESARAVVLR